jgi:hypothetical protein
VATRLKVILPFTNVPAGAQATLPHTLNINDRAVKPDEVKLGAGGTFVFVSATDTDVTILNLGAAAGNCDVLCEHWHSIERAFGSSAVVNLTPQPFVASAAQGAGFARVYSGIDDPSVIGLQAPTGSMYQRTLTNDGQWWIKVGDAATEWALAVPFSIWARSARGFPVTQDATPTFATSIELFRIGDPAAVSGGASFVLSAVGAYPDGSEVGNWVTAAGVQMQAGVIEVTGIGPLPFDFTPNLSSAGAAGWIIRLAQTQPGVLDLLVVGQGAPPHQVDWTVRIAVTATPNLQL